MGLEINKNEEGQYQLKSTISGESYHPKEEWISEEETKKVLINEAFWNFIDKVIEIDMTFPKNYRINDISPNFSSEFLEWHLNALKSENCSEIFATKFEEIYKRLNLDFKIP